MMNVPLRSLVPTAGRETNRRLLGFLITALVHLALILAWQSARKLPSPQPAGASFAVQWVELPAPDRAREPGRDPVRKPIREPIRETQAGAPRSHSRPAPVRAAPEYPEGLAPPVNPATPAPAAAAQSLAAEPATAPASETGRASPGAASILDSVRHSVGGIDRALRKESRPYITAPLDSPQIRMRKGMEQAHALAAPRLWEAPKVDELVNNTGDGARRTRVITGNGTYCVTERSPATSIDMIEKHGKLRLTSCPEHEEPAKQQEWRTARD